MTGSVLEKGPSRPGIIARQGVGGYDENWYAVARSEDVPNGTVIGADFLDGRVIVFRGESGKAAVTSAFCRHVGADLSVGEVIGDTVRCQFHHWCFDQQGHCSDVPEGVEIPPNSDLYVFPVAERYGLIWAYNGGDPRDMELPRFITDEESLAHSSCELSFLWEIDPWTALTNSVDIQHLRALHKLTVHLDIDDIAVGDRNIEYDIEFESEELGAFAQHVKVFGTNTITLSGKLGDVDMNNMYTGTPVPGGRHRGYVVTATTRPPGADDSQLQPILEAGDQFFLGLIEEDRPVLQTIRFRKDRLVKEDKALAKFLSYVEKFPRSHPSQDFIT